MLLLLAAEVGWRKTGVIGGEPGRVVQSPPAKTSENTSSSQPSFTAEKDVRVGLGINIPLTGVGSMSTDDGGLDTELKEPAVERVGVAGWGPRQSVFKGIRPGMSCCTRMVGL